MFMPVFNVDGLNFIEDHWNKEHKILPKRKNMDVPPYNVCKGDKEMGVDINRQFGIDFGQLDANNNYMDDSDSSQSLGQGGQGLTLTQNPCFLNYPGPAAFSEPEAVAYKNFLTQHKNELDFVINTHSNGNAFIYPFNGREKNDIDKRRPGIMPIFQDIVNHAQFPQETEFGTSKEVMGVTIGGDQDDWTLGELGIPSVTAELGRNDQFIDEW